MCVFVYVFIHILNDVFYRIVYTCVYLSTHTHIYPVQVVVINWMYYDCFKKQKGNYKKTGIKWIKNNHDSC